MVYFDFNCFLSERFDFAEIAIPITTDGKISGSPDLLRPYDGPEAVAQILGIVSVFDGVDHSPLLLVRFMRKHNLPDGLGGLKVDGAFPVREVHTWIALTPLITLVKPVLGVKGMFKHIKYLCWLEELIKFFFQQLRLMSSTSIHYLTCLEITGSHKEKKTIMPNLKKTTFGMKTMTTWREILIFLISRSFS